MCKKVLWSEETELKRFSSRITLRLRHISHHAGKTAVKNGGGRYCGFIFLFFYFYQHGFGKWLNERWIKITEKGVIRLDAGTAANGSWASGSSIGLPAFSVIFFFRIVYFFHLFNHILIWSTTCRIDTVGAYLLSVPVEPTILVNTFKSIQIPHC